MRPALLLTVRNLRRRPGQLAVLFILVLTTSAMAYLGLVVSTDYGSYFDRLASETDAPAALVSLPKEEAGQVTELLQADGRVTDVRAMAVKSGNPQIRLNGLPNWARSGSSLRVSPRCRTRSGCRGCSPPKAAITSATS